MRLLGNLLVVGFALALVAGCQDNQPAGARYGEKPRLTDNDAVSLAQVLKDPEKYNGKYVRVKGEVKEVCQKKGCWVNLKDPASDEMLFVKFTCPIDGERLLPLNAVGKTATVEGTIKVEMFSEEDARHVAEESGKTKEQIAAIVGPQKKITLNAPAAIIAGL